MKKKDSELYSTFTHYEEFQTLLKVIPELSINTVTHLRSAGLNYGLMQGGKKKDLSQLGRWIDQQVSQVMQIHYLYNITMRGLLPMAAIASNPNISNKDKYDLPRARTIKVVDLDAIYDDANYRHIVDYLVPGLLHKAFVSRKAFKGTDSPTDATHDMKTVPKSMSNFKFCSTAVVSIVSWIQDAVILTDSNFGI